MHALLALILLVCASCGRQPQTPPRPVSRPPSFPDARWLGYGDRMLFRDGIGVTYLENAGPALFPRGAEYPSRRVRLLLDWPVPPTAMAQAAREVVLDRGWVERFHTSTGGYGVVCLGWSGGSTATDADDSVLVAVQPQSE